MNRLLLLAALIATTPALAAKPAFCKVSVSLRGQPSEPKAPSAKDARALAERVRRQYAPALGAMAGQTDAWAVKEDARALARYGAVLVSAGLQDAGMYVLAVAAAKDLKGAEAWSNLGAFLLKDKDLAIQDDGAKALAFALALDPKDGDAHSNLGNYLFDRGLHDAARAHYQSAVKYAPGADAPKLGLAGVAACKGDAATARKWLEQCTGGTTRWLTAWKSMVPNTPPPQDKVPPKKEGASRTGAARPGGQAEPAKDQSVDGATLPPLMFGVDTGHGWRPPAVASIPGAEEPAEMLGLLPSLGNYVAIAESIEQRRWDQAAPFYQSRIEGRTFIAFRANWTNWRLGQLAHWEGVRSNERRAVTQQYEALRNARLKAIPEPDFGQYQEKREACGRIQDGDRAAACDRKAIREWCASQLHYQRESWRAWYTTWSNFVPSFIKVESDFYARVTDTVYHWVDKDAYRGAVAYADYHLWRTQAGLASSLLGAATNTLTPKLLNAKSDPEWCESIHPGELGGGDGGMEGPSEFALPDFSCPDSLTRSFSTGFADVTVGCQEVAVRVTNGPLFAQGSFNYGKTEFTAYVGGQVKTPGGMAGAEGGAYFTVSKGGGMDVGLKGSANVGAVQVSAQQSISGKASAEVSVFNEKVWEGSAMPFQMPTSSTPYVTPRPP